MRHSTAAVRPRVIPISLAALLFAVAGWIVPDPLAGIALWAVALILGLVILISLAIEWRQGGAAAVAHRSGELLDADPAPTFLTTPEGRLLYHNAVAERMFAAAAAETLADALREDLASPAAVLYRLQGRVDGTGAACDDLVTRRGHLRLSVHRSAGGLLFWRIEKSADKPQRTNEPTSLPLLTVGRHDAILFMNGPARDLIGERVRSLGDICRKLPLRSGQFNDINTSDGVTGCFVVELEGTAGRREVFLMPGVAPTERNPESWSFFDELPVPLLKLARNGDVQLSNRPARDLLGGERCAGRLLGEMVEGLGRPIADWLDDAAAGRGTVHSEILRVKREDKDTFVQITLNRALESGETVLVAVLTDATELKSLEAQFVQSQKMQAIGQLAGGVAHDFNNLLTAISGHCDLLLLRHDQGDEDYGDLVQINQNANRAAALVGQLLAYSRKQTLRPERMELGESLADLTHLLNRLVGEKVTLSLSNDPTLLPIRADKRQLEQVLMNLVVNARDAMPDGGDIEIATRNLKLQEPLRRGRAVVAPGDYVSIEVRDQGIGIASDRMEKVFEPFYTTKRTGDGTGLGLSTAYGIMKQTGGFIFVDSTIGEGTTFQLLLPAYRVEDDEHAHTRQTDDDPAPQADGVVLLVEDESPVRAFASRALQLRGYTVLEAESAEDALEQLRDEDLKVDVFVTDVVMPGIDGPSWVTEALEKRPEVKVVFMSGYAEETFGDVQKKIPQSVFLPKPFSLSELAETVQRQLS
ncbi:ATP-binding protein [Roseovarius sp. SYSU LYC5161]|uniref:ATP-binding protein n=1 Tax=Roseovarius halophilus (ex Wu et al. 2025) TaxID=3376060 RepID=UPI00399AC07B